MPRTLTEPEFNAIRDKVLASAPPNMSEQEFNRYVGPAFQQAIGEAENSPEPVMGSALRRVASGAWSMLNPLGIAEGVAQTVLHPIDTAGNLLSAHADQLGKASDAFSQGRYSEAVGHGAAGLLPIVGPMAANVGEGIAKTGDIATGVGQTAGLLAPMLAGPIAGAAKKAVPAGVRTAVADAMDASAAGKIADVISPKVGANKVRFGNNAEQVAPQLAKDLATDGAPFSRQGFASQIGSKLASAEQQLDAASDARLAARTFETKPIIDALLQRKRELMAQSVDASKPVRSVTERVSPLLDEFGRPAVTTTKTASPLGGDVVPGPNAARVAVIDQAVNELRQLGPVTRYDPIRTLRQAYDGPAKVKYSPAVSADYLKNQGAATGAADVTGVLRETLAQWDPETAKANAQYSLYRKADDVLQATAEVERTRPRVGRQIMARLTGGMVGGQSGGAVGAGAGMVLAPLVDNAISNGVTTQLKTAKILTQMAAAIRGGNVQAVYSLSDQLKRVTKVMAGPAARSIPSLGTPANSAAESTP